MYKNRVQAGQVLAELLAKEELSAPCLLAIPRGGVVVAAPVAERLKAPLYALVTRKIGHPANPEYAIGAVMPDGKMVLDEPAVWAAGLDEKALRLLAAKEHEEIRRRLIAYTGSDAALPAVAGRTAVVIDDGIATGYTVRAAIRWLKELRPAMIIVAVPVAPPETVNELAAEVDKVLCPLRPVLFGAVGFFYQDFGQTGDAEVAEILQRLGPRRTGGSAEN